VYKIIFLGVGGKTQFPGVTKARRIFRKNQVNNENAVSENRLKIPTESLQDAEREDDGE